MRPMRLRLPLGPVTVRRPGPDAPPYVLGPYSQWVFFRLPMVGCLGTVRRVGALCMEHPHHFIFSVARSQPSRPT